MYHSRQDHDYETALKDGKQRVKYGHVMFVGPPGVGKTSLLHALKNEPLPEANSTIVANTKHITPQWVDASGHKHWREITEDDEITELATLAIKVLPEMNMSSTYLARAYKAAEEATIMFAPTNAIPCQLNEQTEKNPLSTLSDVMKKLLSRIEALMRGDRTFLISSDFLHVWDCGGQPIFLDIIPAFLTSRTMFYLLFNASKDIDKNVDVVWNEDGQESIEGNMDISTVDLLLQWVAMIHASTQWQAEDEVPEYPRVTIVGTHADQVRPFTMKAIRDELHKKCDDTDFQDILEETLFVNNSTAGLGANEDPAITQIRKRCHEFGSKLEVDTPLSWILLRKTLKHIAGDRPVISYSDAADVAEECKIPLESLPSVLNFYHELGVFLFYSRVPGLSEKVIISPEWLVQQIGRLFHPDQQELKLQAPRLRKRFKEEGVLEERLYKKVWEDCAEVTSQEMMNLLDFFLLAIPMWKKHPVSNSLRKQYFVPVILTRKQARHVNSYSRSCAPLHIIFPNTNYTPPGYFVRLIASLGKHPKCEVDLQNNLHRNSITLLFGCDGIGKIDEITITESLKNISVSVFRSIEKKNYDFSHVAKEIHMMLVKSLEEMKQWFPFVSTNLAFLCEGHECKAFSNHYVIIKDEHISTSIARCQRNKIHKFPVQEQLWLLDTTLKVSSGFSSGQQYITEDSLLYCSRQMEGGNLHLLCNQLGISDDVMYSIMSRQNSTQGQAAEMLRSWRGREGGLVTADELAVKLNSCGFTTASKILNRQLWTESYRLDERPTLRDLLCLESTSYKGAVRIIDRCENQWEDLGIFLGLEEKTESSSGGDNHHACKQMLKLWLKGSGTTPVNWRTLLFAMGKAALTTLADDIKEALASPTPSDTR